MLFIGVLHPSFGDEPKWEIEKSIDIKQYCNDFIDTPIRLCYGPTIGSIQHAWISDTGQMRIIGKIDRMPPFMALAISYLYTIDVYGKVTVTHAKGCDIVPDAIYKTTLITKIVPISSFICGSSGNPSCLWRNYLH